MTEKSGTGLPDWMQKREDYSPAGISDGALAKNLLRFASVNRDVRRSGKDGKEVFFNPALRLVCVLVLIVLAASGKRTFYTVCVLTLTLFAAGTLPASDLVKALKTALSAFFFALIVLLPSLFLGYSRTWAGISLKVFAVTLLLAWLTASCGWNRLNQAFASLHVPSSAVMMLNLTLFYISCLSDTASALLESLRLRDVGKHRKGQNGFSGIPGTLFLKSQSMAEDTWNAMRLRGYQGGAFKSVREKKETRKVFPADLLMIAVTAVMGCLWGYLR